MTPSQCEHAIRERAYAIWEQEGHPNGRDLNHWFRAEAEIKLLRINELRALVENPASPEAFFQNFEQTIREWPTKNEAFLALERELQEL